MEKVFIYDIETYPNFFCCTAISHNKKVKKLFIIDENRNDRLEIIEFFKNKWVIGYNNTTFDNVVINFIIKNENVNCQVIAKFANSIIEFQNKNKGNFFKEYSQYINNKNYESIDLMRLLFSKKLRVGLKELECSMNYNNVQEIPHIFTKVLNEKEKQDVIDYNENDTLATLMLFEKCLDDIKLRKWVKENFNVDGYSLDSVNLGTKILEEKLAQRLGNRDFTRTRMDRKKVIINDILYPIIQFKTPEFNEVLKKYRKLKVVKYFDHEKQKEVWSKFKLEPVINGYQFKFGLGGLHFGTQSKVWITNDEYTILSVDVASYYPSQKIEWRQYCKPAHLPDEYIDVYKDIKDERLIAKREGDKLKDSTYKLAINGAFGNLNNEYSWLNDIQALLAITVNGQLMLSMLCEDFIEAKIKLIDVNTDGVYIYLHKSQFEAYKAIIEKWQKITKMELEETKFERMFFLTTGDYFGETYVKDKKTGELVLDVKEKGAFITKNRLGKGMEFPIIYKAVKQYFLENKPFEKTIREHTDILDFCSFKKLKRDYTCYWKGVVQQRINRFYASRSGAHLFKKKYDEKNKRYQTDHMLKDSPVNLLNKLEDKPIKEYNINYGFYISKAREIIVEMEGDKNQLQLFI